MTMMTSALPEVRHGLGAPYHNSVAYKDYNAQFSRDLHAQTDPTDGKMIGSREILLIDSS